MAGLQHGDIVKIGAALDEAVLDAERWPALIADVARASGSEGVILLRADKAVSSALSTPSMEAVTARYYAEGWDKIDHRYKGVPLIRTRGVAVDQDFTAPDEFERLPYYQDFMARHGLRWFAGVGFQTDSRFWCVTIQRRVAQGPFEPDEQRSLLELSPALRRPALALHGRWNARGRRDPRGRSGPCPIGEQTGDALPPGRPRGRAAGLVRRPALRRPGKRVR